MGKAYRFKTGEIFQQFSEDTYKGVLAADTEQTVTVPDVVALGSSNNMSQKQIIAVITTNTTSNVLVAVNETVTLPSSTIAAGSGEMIPREGVLIKTVKVGDVLHIISSAGSTLVGIAFYQA